MSSTLAGALVNRPVPPLPPVSLNEPLANGAVVAARYDELSRRIEKAVILESARWGTLNHWRNSASAWRTERDLMVSTFYPQRPGVFLQYCRVAGLLIIPKGVTKNS